MEVVAMPMYRMQFDLSEEVYNEFENLRNEFDLERHELFQAAIRYLQWTWEHVGAGEEIHLVKNGTSNRVNLPYFPSVKR